MAESVVFHLLANFAPFIQEEVNLLTGVRDEIEYIRGEFERMTAFLRVADAMEDTDPGLAVRVKQVREAAYDTGDALHMHRLHLGHHHGYGVCGFLRYHLRTLYLTGHLQRLPRWIPSAFNLVRVYLWYSKLRDADPLRSLQDLPNLASLEIQYAYVGEELCFKAGAFQNLETLCLVVLKELIWVRVEASSMHRLKNLSLVNCKLMADLPSGIEHLTNLERLQLFDMPYCLISRLNRDLQGGDYWKVSHIPEVVIGGWKDGRWQGSFLF
ncbi:hypothetical protein Acr_25g0010180 [Actinidia rufa]|uniref:Rx N-terminal domain-containing protein n=1 Tax=Actinidia rufa TaxID=165716 RepID=A0A7J0H0L9_9ERIC|nr:hypothetical protein Acr_25g0010180 [Actinidia rufa]